MMLAFHTLSVIRRSQKRNLTRLCVVYRENNWQGGQLTGNLWSSPARQVLKFCRWKGSVWEKWGYFTDLLVGAKPWQRGKKVSLWTCWKFSGRNLVGLRIIQPEENKFGWLSIGFFFLKKKYHHFLFLKAECVSYHFFTVAQRHPFSVLTRGWNETQLTLCEPWIMLINTLHSNRRFMCMCVYVCACIRPLVCLASATKLFIHTIYSAGVVGIWCADKETVTYSTCAHSFFLSLPLVLTQPEGNHAALPHDSHRNELHFRGPVGFVSFFFF